MAMKRLRVTESGRDQEALPRRRWRESESTILATDAYPTSRSSSPAAIFSSSLINLAAGPNPNAVSSASE